MSHHDFFGRVRLLRGAFASGSAVTVLALGLLHAAPAAALLPATADCRSDLGGANDRTGETDLTRLCAVVGDGAPFELDTTISLDLARIEGAATIRACSLYSTDGDAFADLAICSAIKGATGNNGNHLLLREFLLYTCNDEKADRCSGATLVAGPYSTLCEASQAKEDPFPGPGPGPGTHYPEDTLLRCQVDTADFGAAGTGARPLDACSYSSAGPDSDPSDCLVFSTCERAADCDDGSNCTADTCQSGVCRHTARAGFPCSNGVHCDGDETCTSLGFCGHAAAPRDCDDGVDCTLDTCDEITDSCANDPRNSVCSDGLYCTGVEACDATKGCQAGTPPNCTDGVSCTVDTCNESTDGCDHGVSGDACSAVLAELRGQAR
ncbi:MAG: hypothetical protein ABR587_08340 [Candidatus Binatia bacterium]